MAIGGPNNPGGWNQPQASFDVIKNMLSGDRSSITNNNGPNLGAGTGAGAAAGTVGNVASTVSALSNFAGGAGGYLAAGAAGAVLGAVGQQWVDRGSSGSQWGANNSSQSQGSSGSQWGANNNNQSQGSSGASSSNQSQGSGQAQGSSQSQGSNQSQSSSQTQGGGQPQSYNTSFSASAGQPPGGTTLITNGPPQPGADTRTPLQQSFDGVWNALKDYTAPGGATVGASDALKEKVAGFEAQASQSGTDISQAKAAIDQALPNVRADAGMASKDHQGNKVTANDTFWNSVAALDSQVKPRGT